MTSSDYHCRMSVLYWLLARTLLFVCVTAILFPVTAASGPAIDGRRQQQQQQQHPLQPQKLPQKRHVSFAVREGMSAGAAVGKIDQSSTRGVPATNGPGGRTAARYSMLPADDGDTRTAKVKSKLLLAAGDLFSVDASTGVLTTRRELDREAICPVSTTSVALRQRQRQRQTVADNSTSCAVVFGVTVRSGGSSSVVMATVVIDDVNDNAPSFHTGLAGVDEHAFIARDVSEATAVGEQAFRLPVAHDADADRATNGRVATYRLEPETSPFRVQAVDSEDEESDEDELIIVLTAPLDREIIDQYNITMIAIDDGVPQLSGTINIRVTVTDVNDNSPKFDRPSPGGYDVTLATDAPIETSVVKVTASDPDLDDNGLVRYRFAARTQARYGYMFSIDAVTGVISTSGHVSFSLSSSTIGLVVLAEDQGQNSVPSVTTVTIRAAEVNRYAPEITFADRSSVAGTLPIAENSPPGSFVGHVVVQDPDVGRAGEVDCTIAGADSLTIGSADDNFRLAPIYGSEYRLITGRSFDREHRETYNITIRCRDFGRPSMTSSLPVTVVITDIDDNEPTFPVDEYRFTIVENNDRGQVIGSVTATDNDLVVISGSSPSTSSGIEYSLAEPDGDTAAWFSVDPTSGNITARVSFDREFVARFEFYVLARSVAAANGVAGRGVTGASTAGTTAKVLVRVNVLDVDDEPPRFARNWYRFDVAESVPIGSEVGRVEAVDEDTPPFNGFFYQLETSPQPETYEQRLTHSGDDPNDERSDDNEDAASGSHFAIDPLTGTIFTRRALDRESLSHYAFRVRAQSDVAAPPAASPTGVSSPTSGPSSDVTMVFVRVADVNDNAPEVLYPTTRDDTVRVPSRLDVRTGDVVATVSARDRDVGANARLTYSIVGGDDERWFEIGLSTGVIRWSRDFVSDITTVGYSTGFAAINGTARSVSRPSSSTVPCSPALAILVADSGTPIQLSTTVLLNVIVEDRPSCRAKSSPVADVGRLPTVDSSRGVESNAADTQTAASDAENDRRHLRQHSGASDGVDRQLFAGLTDWHIFVIVVAFAACLVVFGGLLTAAVVFRRGCSCGTRRRRYQSSPSEAASVEPRRGFGDKDRKDDDDAVELKLLKTVTGGAAWSPAGDLSGTIKGFGNATAVVGRGLDGEPVLVMIDPEQLGKSGHVIMAFRDQPQQHYLSSRNSSISRYCNPYGETTLPHVIPRERDSDSGCGGDLSPAL